MPGLTVGSRWFYLKQILYYISTAFFFKISSPLFRALYLLTVAPNFKTVRTVSNTIYFLWLQSRGGGGRWEGRWEGSLYSSAWEGRTNNFFDLESFGKYTFG